MTDLLFHYTTVAGFFGILTDGVLRATRADFLNDTSELTHARDLFLREFSSRMEAPVRQALSKQKAPHVPFVASFCAAGDLLPLWRGYGGALGIAIGFEKGRLQEWAGRFDFELVQCEYEAKAHVEELERLIAPALEELERLRSEAPADPSVAVDRAAGSLAWNLALLEPRLKSPAFESEREWRLVHPGAVGEGETLPVDFRVRGDELVPYLRMGDAGENRIPEPEQVIIGPGASRETNLSSVSAFLQDKGWSTHVAGSDIPFLPRAGS